VLASLLCLVSVEAHAAVFDDLWSAYSSGHVRMLLDDGSELERERLHKCVQVNEARVFPKLDHRRLLKAYSRAFPGQKELPRLLEQSAHSSYRTSLPRKGTTVTISAGLDLERKPLLRLTWDRRRGVFEVVGEKKRK
jgi:hypothetical protein